MKHAPVSKGRRIIGSILLALCIALLLYFAVVMIVRIATWVDAKKMSAVTRFLGEFGFVCLLSIPAFDIRFGIFTWKRTRGLRATGITLRVLSCAFCALFVALAMTVMITGAITDTTPVQNVCVLGLAIKGDELPRDLEHRLDTAIAYQTAHPDVFFVATGGNSEDPYFSEAEQMARYLAAHGFDTSPDKFATETNAKTTVENFKNCAALMDKTAPVGVVTSNVHMFRATHIAKKQGYTTLVKIPAPSEPLAYGENAMWDTVCVIIEGMMGHLA